MPDYYRGQGKVQFSPLDAQNNPIAFRNVGNSPEVETNYEVENNEHRESTTGQGNIDYVDHISRKAMAKITIDTVNKENLRDAMGGAISTIASGTVTADPLGSATSVVGDIIATEHQKLTSIIIIDSTGTPVTLTPGTHYRENAKHGSIELLDLTGITLPLLIDYGYDEVFSINMSSGIIPDIAVRVEGLNMAKGGAAVLIQMYKFSFDPAKAIKFLSSEQMSFDLEGVMLYDETKENNAVLGQVGRVVLID